MAKQIKPFVDDGDGDGGLVADGQLVVPGGHRPRPRAAHPPRRPPRQRCLRRRCPRPDPAPGNPRPARCGSTGVRRGTVHRFRAMNVTWRRPDEGELGDFAAGVTTLAVSPLSGNAGEVALMLLRAGCTVRLMDDFDPSRVLAAVEAERITSVYLPSPHLERLVSHPDVGRTDLSSLRYLPYGNAPIAPDTLRRAIGVLGPILSQNYVTSELRAVTLLRQEDHLAAADGRPHLLRSAGRPLPGVELRICGPDGRDRPMGEPGEVWLRAPHMMSGYWRDPDATRRVLLEDWLRSGDIGRLDPEGYLYLDGRA
ncbi:class I adenylate-forming enzyme family protein [Streptomyces sp. NPDC101166]|uniref:class I adenylate-forming enzyme family protein n=1 Tax=Streptomyces sp. NPDC101166 TaxID=3366120 RepID=UPI00380AFC9F